ncbi:MAG: tetratricopeptide repeat protein [Aulosira sp. ZfuVER01]|nr:tetratricopeptide repeat protein [Aulosira sp. ZfuVER01]MDZ8001300.1 tetratricopeptide repeat protein [Aulosira sp. DedVER01a]MDZ8050957.1 tetratricopeptide repeat protein [Aulosira sp. ZfuCHP01]
MFNQHQLRQWFRSFSQVAQHRSAHRQLLSTSVAFLVLAAPTIINLPGSKLLAQNVVSKDLDAASFFQQGFMRYNRQDLQGAEYAFREALRRDSNLAIARNYLGNILLQQNRLDVAAQEYAEAIRINPNYGEAYYNLGLALHQQGQREAAITAYRQSLVIDPTMAAAQYNLGLALYEQGQIQEAIAAYQQALNLNGSNANAYFNLAIALQQQGQLPEAIAAYQQALQRDPENATAYNNLGSLMVMQGQTSEAIAVYQQAVRQNPKNALAFYNLGVTLYNQGHIKEANSALKRARQEYQGQSNIAQTDKIDSLMLQIAQKEAARQAQARERATPAAAASTRTIIFKPTEAQQPNQVEVPQAAQEDPGYVPVLEPQPTSMNPL